MLVDSTIYIELLRRGEDIPLYSGLSSFASVRYTQSGSEQVAAAN